MLRLFLRLYVLLALGFGGAIYAVDYVFTELLNGPTEALNRESVRGQAYALVKDLQPLDPAARERQLLEWKPHYGLTLSLVDTATLNLSGREQALLAANQLVVRDEFTEFISRIDDGTQVLVIKLPPEPSLMVPYTIAAYIMLAVLVGITLFFWVRPHWRDLERLRLAAQRFGHNDFGARLHLPRHSNIHELAEHFNQMAARIEGLIANQRELTNAVSHELRTPITRLSFELDQLRQHVDPQLGGELIGDMYADLGELEDMVSELLTYASLEHGAGEGCRQVIPAQSWLDSVVASVALEAEAAGVQLTISACDVETVCIEPRFMARAVINLLRNAIRYAQGRVQVSLTGQADDYQVLVCDDGPGVPLEGRLKIFEPFQRLDASRDRRTGGFGLGLALVRRVSQWHGGQVEVGDSQWGGASFRMTWTRAEAAA